jgi:hypothetical protein
VGDDHADALAALVDAIELVPDFFLGVYWDADLWVPEDAEDFAHMRERIAGFKLLRPLADELSALTTEIQDAALCMGEFARESLERQAADRALELAEEDPIVRKAMGEQAVEYWRQWAPGRRVAARSKGKTKRSSRGKG